MQHRVARRFAAAVVAIVCLAPMVIGGSVRAAENGVRLIVWKKLRLLQVVRGDQVLRTYRISLGIKPDGAKEVRGDGRTPVGIYHVYEKRPSERFRWFLALDYPGSEDADRAFDAGMIDANTWADIYLASKRGERPPWNTPLGGFVGIHGTGSAGAKADLRRVSDWTDGCIALSDHDVDELVRLVPIGATVEIQE